MNNTLVWDLPLIKDEHQQMVARAEERNAVKDNCILLN